MNLTPIFGLIFVLIAVGAIFYFYMRARDQAVRLLREIPAFTNLRQAVGRAVEAGTRLQISLGRGTITSTESAVGFAGLTVLDRIARAASISDRPPVATTGDGPLAILSQDTLGSTYRSMGAENQYDPTSGRLVGVTPFSYAVGTIPIIENEQISANVLVGHFGNEVALMTEAAVRNGSLSIAGSDDLAGQAVIYATAHEPLIGEEVFAGGAYLGAGPMHEASLHAQDLLRLLLIAVILVGSVLTLLGIDRLLSAFLAGGS